MADALNISSALTFIPEGESPFSPGQTEALQNAGTEAALIELLTGDVYLRRNFKWALEMSAFSTALGEAASRLSQIAGNDDAPDFDVTQRRWIPISPSKIPDLPKGHFRGELSMREILDAVQSELAPICPPYSVLRTFYIREATAFKDGLTETRTTHGGTGRAVVSPNQLQTIFTSLFFPGSEGTFSDLRKQVGVTKEVLESIVRSFRWRFQKHLIRTLIRNSLGPGETALKYPWLDMDTVLNLSVGGQHMLLDLNVRTLRDLVQKTEKDFLRLRYYGIRPALKRLKEQLAVVNLSLGMRLDPTSGSNPPAASGDSQPSEFDVPRPFRHRPEGMAGARSWSDAAEMRRGSPSPRWATHPSGIRFVGGALSPSPVQLVSGDVTDDSQQEPAASQRPRHTKPLRHGVRSKTTPFLNAARSTAIARPPILLPRK